MKLSYNRYQKIIFRIIPKQLIRLLFNRQKQVKENHSNQNQLDFEIWFHNKINPGMVNAHWPIHPSSTVQGWRNIYCGIDTSPGLSPGCFISAHFGSIHIGDYTQIGPNVGIHSTNHNPYDSREFIVDEVHIGEYCWIGMGAIILPGVKLGDFTVVGAGSIVTKSFPEGHCIIAGNPAREIKKLDKEKCIPFKNKFEYHGYVPNHKF